MNAKHSSAHVEHYTPEPIVELARATMGSIDLDPASCEFAQRVVRAERFYAPPEDGLALPWNGNVFVNPPGGTERGRSRQALWWSKAVEEWVRDPDRSIVFLAFSLELLQSAQLSGARAHPTEFPCCFPARRIRFDVRARDRLALLEEQAASLGEGKDAARLLAEIEVIKPVAEVDGRWAGDQPTHGNVVVLLPGQNGAAERFWDTFRPLGHVNQAPTFR